MTAPTSSIGSGSTLTMSSTASYLAAHLNHPKSQSTSIKLKRPGAHSLGASSTPTLPAVTSTSKKKSSSLLKFPKKLSLPGTKYPHAKIVKESIALLDDEIKVMTQHAPFLNAVTADSSICLLDRKEVVLGELLGQGQFAQVHHLKDLKLRDDRSLSPQEQTKRQSFVREFHNHNCPTAPAGHSYAVKHLKKDLLVKHSSLTRRKRRGATEFAAGDTELPMDQQFQLAAADLVVEALYLSRLQHPHILSVRGMALGGTAAFGTGRYDSYFLILDQLSETLDQRIQHWRYSMGQPQETQLGFKTEYAYQMACALEHIHQQRIIFRDLKPSNIGFLYDDRLQIFDFGLCRELPPSRSEDKEEVYFMTAAGTHRYMAVEVHMGEQYNLKADVYSFAMVYYELLAQEAPFLNFSEQDHKKLVCERQHRPKHFFGCVVPLSIQNLLRDAWAHSIADRLTMAEVVMRLEDILVHTFQQTIEAKENNGEVQNIGKSKETNGEVARQHHRQCCHKEEATSNPATTVTAVS